MKGWYGNKQKHSMASKGIRSSDDFLFSKSPEEQDFITKTMTPCTKCGEWVNKRHISNTGLCNICNTMARGNKEVFNYNDVGEIQNKLRNGINAPYKNIYHSTLGGKDRVAILITISLDPREEWVNGILENSNYIKLDFTKDGTVEYISGRKIGGFRKIKSNNVEEAIKKINRYIERDGGN